MGKDLSAEKESALELRNKLESAASAHANDVGAADYCCELLKVEVTPGRLITWCLNTNVAALYETAENLWDLMAPLQNIVGVDDVPPVFSKLFDGANGAEKGNDELGWGGESGDAFENRFTTEFRANAEGVLAAIDMQANDILKSGEALRQLQQVMLDALEDKSQLNGFEEKYQKAVAEDDKAEFAEDIESMTKSTMKFGASVASTVAMKGGASQGLSPGVDYVIAMLDRFGNNVKDTAQNTVSPIIEAQQVQAKSAEERTHFAAIPKSDFVPITGKSLGTEWKSE